jgi:hypothetical protein
VEAQNCCACERLFHAARGGRILGRISPLTRPLPFFILCGQLCVLWRPHHCSWRENLSLCGLGRPHHGPHLCTDLALFFLLVCAARMGRIFGRILALDCWFLVLSLKR